MFKKLFGKKDEASKEEKAAAEKKKRRAEAHEKKKQEQKSAENASRKSSGGGGGGGAAAKPRPKPAAATTKSGKASKKRKDKSKTGNVHVDIEKPVEYPCTPEIMLEYHKLKPFLTQNEEWLLVELNEFECLVDGLDIIKIIAKHSKFFEVDPDELWEEFFEYVEEMPSYDEVINYDVWQEFRDEKYPC